MKNIFKKMHFNHHSDHDIENKHPSTYKPSPDQNPECGGIEVSEEDVNAAIFKDVFFSKEEINSEKS